MRRCMEKVTRERWRSLVIWVGESGGRESLCSVIWRFDDIVSIDIEDVRVSRRAYGDNLGRSCRRRAVKARRTRNVSDCSRAIIPVSISRKSNAVMMRTSWILGTSSSSAKTKRPGAEVASWMSFAAAAPLADFDMSTNGSIFAAWCDPSSIVRIRNYKLRLMRKGGVAGGGCSCVAVVCIESSSQTKDVPITYYALFAS